MLKLYLLSIAGSASILRKAGFLFLRMVALWLMLVGFTPDVFAWHGDRRYSDVHSNDCSNAMGHALMTSLSYPSKRQ